MSDITENENLLRSDVRENIQTLHGFIMVLAIGNAIRELAQRHSRILDEDISLITPEISSEIFWSFAIGLIIIFRFFLGDRLYIKRYEPNNMSLFIVDMLNIFISAMLIAYMSFFVTKPGYMFLIITILMVAEVIWWAFRNFLSYIASISQSTKPNIPVDEKFGINIGTVISIITILALAIRGHIIGVNISTDIQATLIETKALFSSSEVKWLIHIYAANTLADLFIKGPSYFGSPSKWILSVKRL